MDLPIIAPTGNGVSAAGLTVSGGGYASTPRCVKSLAAVALAPRPTAVIDANGNLTGITDHESWRWLHERTNICTGGGRDRQHTARLPARRH